MLQMRKRALDGVRRFFDLRGFLEVETPILVPSPGLEVYLDPIPVKMEPRLFLHTSPELAMKRMLAAGSGDIYQVARVFRHDAPSTTHAWEFTMLEWYRLDADLVALMDDVEALVGQLARDLGGPTPTRIRRTSVSQAFVDLGMIDPLDAPSVEALAQGCGVRLAPGDGWDDVFFRAFLEKVEPTFGVDELVLLDGYPRSMAALAELDPVDPRRALRFEAYLGGIELANAFQELSDAAEQRRRFQVDIERRRQRGAEPVPIDEAFLRDLPGIGRCAGIALGFDRLLMVLTGARSLDEVLAFPAHRRAAESG